MGWSWKMGRIAGITVQVHWTFLLLLVVLGYSYAAQGASPAATALGIGFILAVFGCVVLHELGHALVARRFGVPTRDITLLPIGGVARLQRMPEHPRQELLVAIAGPLVNVAIGGGLALLLWSTGNLGLTAPSTVADITRGDFLPNLMWVNILLVGFNLLPAFPMDGGRVLRALLAFRLSYIKATAIAAGVGQAMAMLFGLIGLLGLHPLLVFIALFVFLGAGAEAQQAQIRTLLSNVTVEEAMLSRFRTLGPEDTLGTAADELLAGSQQDFPVIEGDRFIGMLARKALVAGLQERGRDCPVRELVSEGCPSVGRHDSLEEIMRRMREESCSAVAVLDGDRFAGVLTLENVGEFMMIRSALEQNGTRAPGSPISRSPVETP